MIAITRDVSPAVAECELTHLARTPIDYDRAVDQHRRYRELLSSLGCEVIDLPADAAHPDCVFIEDTAIVLDDVAVITRPGAPSRRGETPPVAAELARHRRVVTITEPATLDGGDVLVLDGVIYAGLSSRSNETALEQLRSLTGRVVTGIPVSGALHLKTAVTQVAREALLVNRDWLDPDWLVVMKRSGWILIDVDPSEPFAANALLAGTAIVYPAAFPRTRARLEAHGLPVHPIEADELAKAEGGVTCCALVF